MRKIVITFNPDGTAKVGAYGFAGQGCQEATKPYEQAVLKDDKAVEYTDDYYKAEGDTNTEVLL